MPLTRRPGRSPAAASRLAISDGGGRRSIPLAPYALMAALLLVTLDILVRRLG